MVFDDEAAPFAQLAGVASSAEDSGGRHRDVCSEPRVAALFPGVEDLLQRLGPLACGFAALEVCALLALGDSAFGSATAPAFANTVTFERTMKFHVWCAALMWVLGAVQVLSRGLRWGQHSWVHKRLGYSFLLIYWLAVWPTSLWLGLHQRVERLGPVVTAILLEIAMSAAYFFWRGFVVARARRHGDSSLVLHGKLMRCGLVMTMAILPQRSLQFLLTLVWWLLTLVHQRFCLPFFGPASAYCHWAPTTHAHQVNYTLSMIVTSNAFVWYGHFFDGPRGWVWRGYLGKEHAEEAYGSVIPGRVERYCWLGRWLVYVAAYFLASPGRLSAQFAVQPLPVT